jgi:recombination DNA repair RAD52 pathway protein
VYGDVGYGDGSDKTNPGKAHELAAKEAVTDALKRCAKNLGMSMGLALYDKTQENVDEGSGTHREEQPRSGAGNPGRAAGNKPSGVERADEKRNAPAEPASVETASGPSAAKSREEIDALIQSTHRVAVAKRKTTKEKTAEYLKATFGVDASKALNDSQASQFLNHLNTLI